jgi:hypothetical protein
MRIVRVENVCWRVQVKSVLAKTPPSLTIASRQRQEAALILA